MKRKITSLLLAVVMVLAMATGALAAEGSDFVEVKAQSGNGVVTLTISAKQTTTNGKFSVSYNSGYLSYAKTESGATISSTSAKNGTVTLGYAVSSADAFAPGETIAVLYFDITGKWLSTEFQLTLGNFNDQAEVDLKLPLLLVSSGDTGTITVPDVPVTPGKPSTPTQPETPTTPDTTFTDVKSNDWFADAVDYVVSKGYFKGTSATTFGPDESMSRAMFVTVLGRMAGVDADSYVNTLFSDLATNAYYEGFVVWAQQNGIVQGTSDTTFAPNESVTREQMAVFLYRYAAYLGMDVSVNGSSALNSFADASSVSPWARDAMAWAVSKGIITGTDRGLEPLATASRAQVAQIIYRFDALAK